MDIDKIVSEMPRVLSDYATYHVKACRDGDLQPCTGCLTDVWDEATEAHCKLLAEQGYRKLPDDPFLYRSIFAPRIGSIAKTKAFWLGVRAYHRWLLEGE